MINSAKIFARKEKLMKNNLANKFLFAAFLAFTAINCSSAAPNLAINSNIAAANSDDAVIKTQETGEAVAAVAAIAPEELIADLYKQHDANNSPFFQTKNRALVDKYFTKATADLIWNDLKNTPEGETGALDADPLYSAQDSDIKNFKVGKGTISGDKAAVPVTFLNFGEKHKVDFQLVTEKNSWKISDIKYDNGYSMVELYKANLPNHSNKEIKNSPSGEFEGKYQVGDTTCTVKPIKMAFEVKWAKGTGVETFFPSGDSGDNSFESEAIKGKTNVFVFEDENYNKGVFVRADGKQFAVKRIK